MSDEPSVYQNNCSNAYEPVKGWNGLISSDGKFYKLAERSKQLNSDLVAHLSEAILKLDLVAEYKSLQLNKTELRNKQLTSIEILTNVMGYVIYYYYKTCGLKVICPSNEKINSQRITGEQLSIIYNLIDKNRDSHDQFYDCFSKKISIDDNSADESNQEEITMDSVKKLA